MLEEQNDPGDSEAGTENAELEATSSEASEEVSGEEGEQPAKPKEEVKPDRFSSHLAKLAKREQEALRVQREAKREIEEAKHWKSQVESRAQEFLEIRKESEQLKSLLRDLHDGPNAIETLQKLGLDFEKLIESVAVSGTPSAQIRSTKAELDRKLEKIEKWQQEQEEARKRYIEEQQARAQWQQRQELVAQKKKDVVQIVRDSTDKYPEISGLSDRRMIALFEEKATELAVPIGRKRSGEVEYEWPSLDKVFTAMETELAEEDKGRSTHRAKRSGSASSTGSKVSGQAGSGRPSGDGGDGSEAPDETPLVKAARARRESARPDRPKPKTLTNEHAAVIATQKSTRPSSSSREELRRMLARKYLVPSSH